MHACWCFLMGCGKDIRVTNKPSDENEVFARSSKLSKI